MNEGTITALEHCQSNWAVNQKRELNPLLFFQKLMLTCDEHRSEHAFEVLKWAVSQSDLLISNICFAQIHYKTDLCSDFTMCCFLPSPSLRFIFTIPVGISINEMHAKPRYLGGNGMKTRPSSIPKHPAHVQWCSFPQSVIHLHVDRQDERDRWRHLWGEELRLSFAASWLSRLKLWFISAWNDEDAFLCVCVCVCVDRLDK